MNVFFEWVGKDKNEPSTSRGRRNRQKINYNPIQTAEEVEIFGQDSDGGDFSPDGTEDEYEPISKQTRLNVFQRTNIGGHPSVRGRGRGGRGSARSRGTARSVTKRRKSAAERAEMLSDHQQIVDEMVEREAERNLTEQNIAEHDISEPNTDLEITDPNQSTSSKCLFLFSREKKLTKFKNCIGEEIIKISVTV